jgi:hypothetical protein
MAYTVTPNAELPDDTWGSQQSRLVVLQPAASDYPTGGYALVTGQGIALAQVIWCLVVGNPSPYLAQFDQATGKLIFYGSGGGVPSGTIVTTMTTTTNASTANPVNITAGAVTSTTGVAGVTGFTSTFTGSAGGGTSFGQVSANTDLSAYSFLLLINGY